MITSYKTSYKIGYERCKNCGLGVKVCVDKNDMEWLVKTFRWALSKNYKYRRPNVKQWVINKLVGKDVYTKEAIAMKMGDTWITR